MDFDPTLFAAANCDTDREQATTPPDLAAVPLPPISLPAAPRPSLSPAASRVFDRKQVDQPPRMNSGLDLSQPVSPRAQTRHNGASGAANDFEDSVASTRAEKANRDDDSRDTASIRQNILNLVNAGQAQTNGSRNATTSLAQMMGASGQKRTHRVNTGMTELEREETERLEREMAATRARWAGKEVPSVAGTNASGPAAGGLSLASLLTGKTTSRAATAPAIMEPARTDEPANSAAEPISATRDSAQPQKDLAPAEPAQAEPRRFAASPEPTSAVEPPKAVTPPLPSQPTTFAPSLRSASQSEQQTSPRKPTDTLTRLQASNIVSERLRWSEQIQQRDSASSASEKQTPSAPPSPEKRRSVLERWGRDEPNTAGQGSLPTSIPSSPTAVRTRPKSIFDAPSSSVPAAVAEKEEASQLGTDSSESAPKLQHVTRDRARPTKSTARSGTAPPTLAASGVTTEKVAPMAQSATPAPAEPAEASEQTGKPTWQGAPIGVKTTSKPPAEVELDEVSQQPATRHTRGVALPGMSAPSAAQSTHSAPPFKSPPTEAPQAAQATPPASPSKSAAGGGVSSVRAAAMRWGQQADAAAEEEKRATLAALKASYGVKVESAPPVRQATMPAPAKPETTFSAPQKSKSLDASSSVAATPSTPAPIAAAATASPAAPVAVVSQRAPSKTRPDLSLSTSKSSPDAPLASNDIVQLVLSQPEPYHLPPGETLSLDVFHLNSPTDHPDPIDHNHVLHTTEILGIVHRAEDAKTGGVRTHVWVWKGDEAKETKRTDERIIRLEDKTGVEAVEVEYRHEPPALAEAFAGQLTICRGPREAFDHLARRMFSVQSHDGVVYVEEVPASSRSLCSGYSTTFSALGEVYAWLGEGSLEEERHACCEFAEAIADGRTVTVLLEGEETAMFWHHLPDDNEYASAQQQYWRRRPSYPHRTSVVRVDASGSSPSFTLVSEGDIPLDAVSVIDGGATEHWVIVPEVVKSRKADIRIALDATKQLSDAWRERGFASRTPYHLLAFPSLIPRELSFLSRGLDLDILNGTKRPAKMQVFTASEAASEFL
ncbi:hypothetical protein JCM10908_006434 [Rhodotorula pacifica]|uniref:uncharacterized protein n=1 Tax=Rhodotorula pacifica TaxID=1495444 RepID=UPI00317F6258